MALGIHEPGDRLGAFQHSVLGQLRGQDEAHRRPNLARTERRLLVDANQTRRLSRQLLEDIVHERVQDAHGIRGDPRVTMHLESIDRSTKVQTTSVK